MIVLTGIIIGVVLALVMNITIPPAYSQYVAIGILAALDSVFGAISSSINKTYNFKVFIAGLFSNALLASGLTYVGKSLGVDISIAAIVVFGTRLFSNFAVIRRFLLNKLASRKKTNENPG